MAVAYLGEGVEISEPSWRFPGPKGVFLCGFTDELPSCVLVEQLVAMPGQQKLPEVRGMALI